MTLRYHSPDVPWPELGTAATTATLAARAIEDGLVRPNEIGTYRSQASYDRPTP